MPASWRTQPKIGMGRSLTLSEFLVLDSVISCSLKWGCTRQDEVHSTLEHSERIINIHMVMMKVKSSLWTPQQPFLKGSAHTHQELICLIWVWWSSSEVGLIVITYRWRYWGLESIMDLLRVAKKVMEPRFKSHLTPNSVPIPLWKKCLSK